jgi:hypothetical protein
MVFKSLTKRVLALTLAASFVGAIAPAPRVEAAAEDAGVAFGSVAMVAVIGFVAYLLTSQGTQLFTSLGSSIAGDRPSALADKEYDGLWENVKAKMGRQTLCSGVHLSKAIGETMDAVKTNITKETSVEEAQAFVGQSASSSDSSNSSYSNSQPRTDSSIFADILNAFVR